MCPPAWTRDCRQASTLLPAFSVQLRKRERVRAGGHMAEGPTAMGFNPSGKVAG